MKAYFAGTLVDRTLAHWRQALLAVLLLALLLTTLPAAPAVYAATNCTVAASGAMYPTIQAAVKNTNCTTINVAAGTYIENVTIGRDLTINGSTTGSTIVDGHNVRAVFSMQSNTVTLANLTIRHGSGNSSDGSTYGGGILNNQGTLTVTNSTISGNSADHGGGIYNSGRLTVVNSTISGNNAPQGGGIYNSGTLNVAKSTLSGNSGGCGGGIYIYSPDTTTVTNSTLSGNNATNYGGAICLNQGPLTVTNSTFSGNSAPLGSVIRNDDTMTLVNTIVANSTGGIACINSGTITNSHHNLTDDATCLMSTGTDGNIFDSNTRLGPLQNNGGPTQTHALLSGSPAINAGDDATCEAAPVSPTDQRGTVRHLGPHCDIGAYEWMDTTPPDTTITTNPSKYSTSPAASFTFTGTDDSGVPISIYKCSLDGAGFTPCTSPQSYSGLTDGGHTFQVRAMDYSANTDPSPASFQWKIDTVAPDTTIKTFLSNPSASSAANFAFTGTDPNDGVASYACSLDGVAFTACTSPQNYSGLKDGSHTFQVRAIDFAGNVDATPATYTWTIRVPTSTPTNTPVPPTSTPTVSALGV